MENPSILSASSSGRRSSSASNSPEFEFWMVRNPSFPETALHSADELFSGGVLLPLQLITTQNSDDPPDKDTPTPPPTSTTTPTPTPEPGSGSGPDLATTFTASKRWKDIFKKNPESKDKEKKKKGGSGGGGASTAELNINLWPFSRSRSAGNGGSRPRAAVNRKVSSAPCSRSNSAGESKSRKWPASPSRGGVHLGRSSPVWQVKRVGSGRSLHDNLVRTTAEKGLLKKEGNDTRRSKKSTTGGAVTGSGKAKVLNINVPTCIGYRHHLSCKSGVITENRTADNGGVVSETAGVVSGGEGARGNNMFNLRNFFTKKVY